MSCRSCLAVLGFAAIANYYDIGIFEKPMRTTWLAAAILGYGLSPALASPSEVCAQADGSRLMSFDQAWDLVSAIPNIRDEFERTADFEERQVQALTAVPEIVAVQFPIDREHLRYDADAQALLVRSFALSNIVADNHSAVFGPFSVLGSRLIDRQSQNRTVAARAMAERKV
ncbi:hypothetical protein, partial [Rhodovulum strictum]